MNKKELKEFVKKYKKIECNWQDCELNSKLRLNRVGRHEAAIEILDLIDQLDEPEKPVVPQFVADWFEKEGLNNLENRIVYQCNHEKDLPTSQFSEFDKWFSTPTKNPIETLIKMKDGYEVEKPLYHMPLPYQSNSTIYYYKQDDGKISFKQGGMMKDHSKFTQEELDKYFPEIKHMAEEVQE